MYRIYISSTIDDLVDERAELIRWLSTAEHQPVESYTASTDPLLDSCFSDIARCDVFVLILGDRYGWIPEANNHEKLSVVHLEYREARKQNLPCMVFVRTSTPNKALSDLYDPARNAGFLSLLGEVESDQGHRPAEFKDSSQLVSVFSASFLKWLQQQPTTKAHSQGHTLSATTQPLTAGAIAQAVRRSAIEGLNSPREWFENWTGEVFEPPLPPSHALLQSCFIDTGLRARVIASLKAGGQTGITGFIGMGGVGKTFTALRIAWDLRSEGWQICWVSLLQRSTDDVLDNIAHNFGFRFVPNLGAAEKAAALRSTLQLVSQKLGKVLIVLDNAEQFPDFAQVVSALSHLPVLVTSRTNEQAGRIRYERIEPLTQARAIEYCLTFLNANREGESIWESTAEDRQDLVTLADLYKGHPLSIRIALTGYLQLPRAKRTGQRPLQHLLQILKDRGLQGFASDNTTVYSDDEPSEKVLRSNMEATFQWRYDDLSHASAPLVDKAAFILLPLCAAVGAATFDLDTVSKAVDVLKGMLPARDAELVKFIENSLDEPLKALVRHKTQGEKKQTQKAQMPSMKWHEEVRQMAASRDLILEAIFRLEHISLVDPVAGQSECFAMHPTVREFALRQEDASDFRRPSNELLLRASLGTLVEGVNVSDALLNLLPWLKGRRSLVEQACSDLHDRWRYEQYRNWSVLRVWAEEVLSLANDLRLTDKVIEIKLQLGELLDRTGETIGLKMLHEGLQLFSQKDELGNIGNLWPAFNELTVPICFNAITPKVLDSRGISWAAVYLATSIPDCSSGEHTSVILNSLRKILDKGNGQGIWNRFGHPIQASFKDEGSRITYILPFDKSSTNAFFALGSLYHSWTLRGVSSNLAALALDIADRVEVFPASPPSSPGEFGLITPQHWIYLRSNYLGFKLLQDGMSEAEFLEQVASLREFSLAQGIRAFELEHRCSLLLARKRIQLERWDEAASSLKRAIAATHEIPRHPELQPEGRFEMSLLLAACLSLSDHPSEVTCIDLQNAEQIANGAIHFWALPYVYIAQACHALKEKRVGDSYCLAEKAAKELQTGSNIPTYLLPLLKRLLGTLPKIETLVRKGPNHRADWEHLPPRVVSKVDGRTMHLVRHGIGTLMDGKRQAWMWPFYIDDAPLTVGHVREIARRANYKFFCPENVNDDKPIGNLEEAGLRQLLNFVNKTIPTAQERFAAVAQSIGVQRWSSDQYTELDRFQLTTIENIMKSTEDAEVPWFTAINKLLQSFDQPRIKENPPVTSNFAPTTPIEAVSAHYNMAWLDNSESLRYRFEVFWLPLFIANPNADKETTHSLAKKTLASISLKAEHKIRIIKNASTLSSVKVTEFIEIFRDEEIEFKKLWATEGEVIRGLIEECMKLGESLLKIDFSGIVNNDDNIVALDFWDAGRESDRCWHMQVDGSDKSIDKGACIRLVRPIFMQSDMEGLEPIG